MWLFLFLEVNAPDQMVCGARMSTLMEMMDDTAMEITGLATTIKIRDQSRFLHMIKAVAAVCSSSDAQPVLSMLKFDVKKKMPKGDGSFHAVNAIFLTGSNGVQSLLMGTAAIEGATDSIIEADRETSILVPAKTFAGMLSKMPSGNLFLEIEEKKVTLKAGKAKYSLSALDASEYPTVELTSSETITVHAQTLINALKATSYAMSTKEEQGAHFCGVHVRNTEHGLMFEATDRSRAALEILKDVTGPIDVILSSSTIKVICDVFKDATGDVRLCSARNTISISGSGSTVISRILDGIFPNLDPLFSKTTSAEFMVDREALIGIFERSVALIGKDKSAVDLKLVDQEIHISAKGELGSGSESIPIIESNGEVSLRLSPSICIDALNNLAPYARVRFKIKGALLPILLEGLTEDGQTASRQAVVAPIRPQEV